MIFQLDICVMGRVFFPQFCDRENLANFSKNKKITQNFVLENLFIRKFPKFCLSRKDKISQGKKIAAHGGGYGKSLLLNPANYTSNL